MGRGEVRRQQFPVTPPAFSDLPMHVPSRFAPLPSFANQDWNAANLVANEHGDRGARGVKMRVVKRVKDVRFRARGSTMLHPQEKHEWFTDEARIKRASFAREP